MKIVGISGARPQFIKLAPIIKELQNQGIEFYHVHTGQHYDERMSTKIFSDLDIPSPDINLEIGSIIGYLQVSKMIEKISDVLINQKPDAVMVIGDTNSTIAGALSSGFNSIPIIHIEAGMRSHDWTMPEEFNRIVTDRISSLFVTSTKIGYDNLIQEGINYEQILLSGDLNVDSINYIISKKSSDLNLTNYPESFLLSTIHRKSNVDQKSNLLKIYNIFKESSIPILLPLHPRTHKNMIKFELYDKFNAIENLHIVPPLGYLDFISLIKKSEGVITDSGGIQKEAFILNKPCITLRETTEWIETVEYGANRLLNLEQNQILESIKEIKNKSFNVTAKHPYGDGKSAVKIVSFIKEKLFKKQVKFEDNIKRK